MKYSDRLGKDTLAIFLFHGVIETHENPIRNYTRKHLDAARFDEILEDLCDHGAHVTMDDIADGAELPPMAFAITFDDGFANNLTVAAPILELHGVPATFYLTTGFIDHNLMSWTDRIEWAFEQVDRIDIQLPWGQFTHVVSNLGKMLLLDQIRKHVKEHPSIDTDRLAGDIQMQLPADPRFKGTGPLDQKLTWGQVRTLQAMGHTIGGHTHTHRSLAAQSTDGIIGEIDMCVDRLRAQATGAVEHFSYPEGQERDFDVGVIAVLKDRGIRCCPTAIDGVNRAGDDLFRLKRISVDQ